MAIPKPSGKDGPSQIRRRLITKDPLNAETLPEDLKQDITSSASFYVRNHFPIPDIDPAHYSLKVAGVVHNPIQLSLADLKSLSSTTLRVTMECAGNGRLLMDPVPSGTPWGLGAISIADFTGARLVDLLAKAGIREGASEVLFLGADRGEVAPNQQETYSRSLPISVAKHPDTLLVWAMNGERLLSEHGAPLRLLVPGWYGMASVKWLQKIEILTTPFLGFFQRQHYVYQGEEGIPDGEPVTQMRVRSLILYPAGAPIPSGRKVTITGLAWSGEAPVVRVQISLDGGHTWQDAALETQTSPYAARRWALDWQPMQAGKFTLVTRASDASGGVQPLTARWNKGGYGNNVVQRVRVDVL